ncbi:uncharacterized protein JCM6883_000775 [Sporobolomyces salmoneus]|uniref:uncharacterized protein n=1 Tax=Sporobolomyces salmoneus TaxID=183962 RepID=UPI003178B92B
MNSAYDGWDQDLSDDEDEQLDEYRYSKSSILFCIEATSSMLEPSLNLELNAIPPATFPAPSATSGAPPPSNVKQDDEQKTKHAKNEIRKLGWKGKTPPKSKLEVVLLAAFAMMKRKVISSPKDQVGIVIWNTDKTKNSPEAKLENSITLFPPTQVTAKNLRMMKDLLEKCENDPNYLANEFAPAKGNPRIPDAFGHCSTLLIQHSPTAQNQIFWVTDNDDPIRGTVQLFNVAMNKRKDLKDRNIDLQPFFVPPSPNHQFDLDKFYGQIVSMYSEADDSMPEFWPEVHSSLEVALFGMIQSMRLKESAKRVAFKIPFQLADGFVIGVSGYNMIGEERKKLPTKIDANTEQGTEVVSEVVYKDGDTAEEIKRGQIKKFFQVGHADIKTGVKAAKIFLSEDEVRKVKAVGRLPGLKLLGFVPREGNLHFWQSIKQSYFIYPEEDRWEGSTRTFASLLKSMIEKDVIAYASFIGRRAARPQIVVLLPQAEKLNEAGVQVLPPGIHLCQLPFADDIRELGIGKTLSCHQVDEDGELTEEQPAIDKAKKIIKHLTRAYNPDSFPNPALNYFYECLAAVALGEDEIPEPEDKTFPPYESINERVGLHIASLKELIPPEEYDPSRVVVSKSVRPKKASELGPPPDLSDFLEELRSEKGGDLSKYKVDELKNVLRKVGQRTTGKKADLVESLEAYLLEHDLLGDKKKKKAKDEDDAMDVDGEEEEKEIVAKPAKRRKKTAALDDSE